MRIYNSVVEILREHPQQIEAWQPLDSMFTAFASDLNIPPGGDPRAARDPWNRSFPTQKLLASRDAEGDITFWDLKTTVNGDEVLCRIFND